MPLLSKHLLEIVLVIGQVQITLSYNCITEYQDPSHISQFVIFANSVLEIRLYATWALVSNGMDN
jgi:hypothetical protein